MWCGATFLLEMLLALHTHCSCLFPHNSHVNALSHNSPVLIVLSMLCVLCSAPTPLFYFRDTSLPFDCHLPAKLLTHYKKIKKCLTGIK